MLKLENRLRWDEVGYDAMSLWKSTSEIYVGEPMTEVGQNERSSPSRDDQHTHRSMPTKLTTTKGEGIKARVEAVSGGTPVGFVRWSKARSVLIDESSYSPELSIHSSLRL